MQPLTLHAFGELAAHIFAARPPAQATNDVLELGRIEMTVGGGSTLVCQQVAALGHRVRLDAMVGHDSLGSWLLAELHDLGIECPEPLRNGARSTRTLVLHASSGSHAIVHEPSDADRSRFTVAARAVTGCRFAYAPGFPGFEPVLEAMSAAGVETVVDLGYRPWLVDPDTYRTEVLRRAQFATVGLLSADGLDDSQRERLMVDVAAAGSRVVVATLGPRGAWVLADGGPIRHVSAVACKPVNTLGAGDAFAAGFIVGLAEGLDPVAATGLACATAAAVITMFPSLPNRADVDAMRSLE